MGEYGREPDESDQDETATLVADLKAKAAALRFGSEQDALHYATHLVEGVAGVFSRQNLNAVDNYRKGKVAAYVGIRIGDDQYHLVFFSVPADCGTNFLEFSGHSGGRSRVVGNCGRDIPDAGANESEVFLGISHLIDGPEGVIPSFVSILPFKERTDFRWQILAASGQIVPEVRFGGAKGEFHGFKRRASGSDGGGVTGLVKDSTKVVDCIKEDAGQRIGGGPKEFDLVNFLSGLRIFIDDVGPCVSVDKITDDSIEILDVMLCTREGEPWAIEQISHDNQNRSDERARVSAGAQKPIEHRSEAARQNENRRSEPKKETSQENNVPKLIGDGNTSFRAFAELCGVNWAQYLTLLRPSVISGEGRLSAAHVLQAAWKHS